MNKINDSVIIKRKSIFKKSKLISGIITNIQTKEKEDMFGEEYTEKRIFIKLNKKIICIDNIIPKWLQAYEIVK